MRIAITGGRGFIGRNLQVRLQELGQPQPVLIPHDASANQLRDSLTDIEFVFHLAGVNRPKDPVEFASGNHAFTRQLCEAMAAQLHPPRVAFASSTQATLPNAYGVSKREAEDELLAYARQHHTAAYLFRLTNVFGKWSRPHYNSAVATFCYSVTRGETITINDQAAPLKLVYIDDVVKHFCALLDDSTAPSGFMQAGPEYETTVGALAEQIGAFHASRDSLLTERVGSGLTRALYATYVSFLPPAAFEYAVPRHADSRGIFVEMLKTPDCGQFGYFTAHPGITRGEHYHHTKTEKFLVIKGTARFGFRHILTNEAYEIVTVDGEGRVVETIPGWTHNVTNIGVDELVVLVWANEIFDRTQPDTVANKVDPA